MSNSKEIIKKEIEKGGTARMVKVPPEKRPTIESLKKLQREVNAQINANEVMREKSRIREERGDYER